MSKLLIVLFWDGSSRGTADMIAKLDELGRRYVVTRMGKS